MPILNYGMNVSNWTLVTSLSKAEIYVFRQFIYEAKKKFKYKNDKTFLKTLDPNLDFKKPYVYKFDSTINKETDNTYILKMQSLWEEANKLMDKQYKDYKLDIMGTWDTGYIVLMRRSNAKPDDRYELARKATMKRLQDYNIISNTSFLNNLGKKR